MSTLLLIYDWACGQVVSVEGVGDDPAEAEAARAAAAWAHADDSSIEVSLVEAESRA